MQEIEHPVFFDLQFLSRPLEILDVSPLLPQEEQKDQSGGNK
jgi:hypothetical protein